MIKCYFKIVFYLMLFSLSVIQIRAQAFEWVKGSSGKGIQGGGKISSDYRNNAYLAENIRGGFMLDTAHYNDNGFVMLKYNAAGALIRSKVIRGAHVNSISAGIYGDCVVTGYYDSSVVFDTTHLNGTATRSIFTAKYDTTGKLLWVKTLTGNSVEGRSVFADPYGNTYVAGVFQFTLNAGNSTVVSQGGDDIFVAKYDTIGRILWVKRAGGGKDDAPTGICTDVYGNLYMAGYIGDNATFGTVNIVSAGGRDAFVARYNNYDGALAWVNAYGGPNDDEATAISADASGRTYITGFFNGTVTFGSMTLSSVGQKDIFLILHNSVGKIQWAHSAGGVNGVDEGLGLSCDGESNAYLTGHFLSTVNFDSQKLDGNTNDDVFIAKYAENGKLLWLKRAGGTGAVIGTGICRNADGGILITGTIKGNAIFDKQTYSGDTSWSLFICKLNEEAASIKQATDLESAMKIYPNPARQQIYIEADELHINKADIINLNGQKAYSVSSISAPGIITIPLNNVKAGIYILSVQYDKGVANRRIVVQ